MNDAVSLGMLSLQWRGVEIHPERACHPIAAAQFEIGVNGKPAVGMRIRAGPYSTVESIGQASRPQ
jgi:hypothetical protein